MLMRRLLIVCVVSTALPLTLAVAFRALVPESSALDFVLWNLALAWVPLVAALALDKVPSNSLALQLPLLGLWLAFLRTRPTSSPISSILATRKDTVSPRFCSAWPRSSFSLPSGWCSLFHPCCSSSATCGNASGRAPPWL